MLYKIVATLGIFLVLYLVVLNAARKNGETLKEYIKSSYANGDEKAYEREDDGALIFLYSFIGAFTWTYVSGLFFLIAAIIFSPVLSRPFWNIFGVERKPYELWKSIILIFATWILFIIVTYFTYVPNPKT